MAGLLDILSQAWNDPAPSGMVSMVQGIGRGLLAPGRATQGYYAGVTEEDLMRGTAPQGRMLQDVMGLTGAAVTGGMPMAVRGAVGMAGGRPSVPQVPPRQSIDDIMAEINRHWMQIPAAERNAMLQTSRMRREMGVAPTPTGDPRTDAVIKAIEEALKHGPK